MAPRDLPAEIILQIVESLIPRNVPVVFAAKHPVTRTLCSLTLVCKLVSRVAARLLIKHCLCIDNHYRMRRLLHRPDAPLDCIESWQRLPSSIGLFLSPFPKDNLSLLDALDVCTLSEIICGSLTRLVIDMPLRSLYPEDDYQQVRPILRRAFANMTMLEEFCSVKDELYLSTVEGEQEPAIWSFWPRLKRLALYNVDVPSRQFLDGLRRCLNLTHLVLVRPDGLSFELPGGEIDPGFLPSLQRLVVVNTREGFLHSTLFDQKWELSFAGRLDALRRSGDSGTGDSDSETVSVVSYLTLRTPFGRDGDSIEICQEWLSAQAISGTLWGATDTRCLLP